MKISAWLLQYFADHPDAAMTTTDVIMRSRGIGIDDIANIEITKSQRVSTIRAMNNIADPLRIMDGEGPCGQTIIFNSHNVRSYALGRLKGDWWEYYQWRRDGGYSPHLWEETRLLDLLDAEPRNSKLMAAPAGAWYLHVQQWIANDAGDQTRVAEIEAALKAMLDGHAEEARAALAVLNSQR